MKKLLPILLLLVSLNISAQHKQREQIKALKVSFITEKLDLTEKEAQKFWPIYNAHEKETSTIKYNEIRSIKRKIKSNIETMTDEKAIELLKKLNNAEMRLDKLKIDLTDNLKGVLPPKKIIFLIIAEEDFKRKILEQYRNHKKEKN